MMFWDGRQNCGERVAWQRGRVDEDETTGEKHDCCSKARAEKPAEAEPNHDYFARTERNLTGNWKSEKQRRPDERERALAQCWTSGVKLRDNLIPSDLV